MALTDVGNIGETTLVEDPCSNSVGVADTNSNVASCTFEPLVTFIREYAPCNLGSDGGNDTDFQGVFDDVETIATNLSSPINDAELASGFLYDSVGVDKVTDGINGVGIVGGQSVMVDGAAANCEGYSPAATNADSMQVEHLPLKSALDVAPFFEDDFRCVTQRIKGVGVAVPGAATASRSSASASPAPPPPLGFASPNFNSSANYHHANAPIKACTLMSRPPNTLVGCNPGVGLLAPAPVPASAMVPGLNSMPVAASMGGAILYPWQQKQQHPMVLPHPHPLPLSVAMSAPVYSMQAPALSARSNSTAFASSASSAVPSSGGGGVVYGSVESAGAIPLAPQNMPYGSNVASGVPFMQYTQIGTNFQGPPVQVAQPLTMPMQMPAPAAAPMPPTAPMASPAAPPQTMQPLGQPSPPSSTTSLPPPVAPPPTPSGTGTVARLRGNVDVCNELYVAPTLTHKCVNLVLSSHATTNYCVYMGADYNAHVCNCNFVRPVGGNCHATCCNVVAAQVELSTESWPVSKASRLYWLVARWERLMNPLEVYKQYMARYTGPSASPTLEPLQQRATGVDLTANVTDATVAGAGNATGSNSASVKSWLVDEKMTKSSTPLKLPDVYIKRVKDLALGGNTLVSEICGILHEDIASGGYGSHYNSRDCYFDDEDSTTLGGRLLQHQMGQQQQPQQPQHHHGTRSRNGMYGEGTTAACTPSCVSSSSSSSSSTCATASGNGGVVGDKRRKLASVPGYYNRSNQSAMGMPTGINCNAPIGTRTLSHVAMDAQADCNLQVVAANAANACMQTGTRTDKKKHVAHCQQPQAQPQQQQQQQPPQQQPPHHHHHTGEKVSGVWYDTNRHLWRVVYMKGNKRKTQGFSSIKLGYEEARRKAIQMRHEMVALRRTDKI